MRKILMITTLCFIMVSCKSKSSFESDVKKMAKYRCQEMQLKAKDQTDPKVAKDLENLEKDMDAYRKEMAEKYKGHEKDDSMNNKANKIMDEEMAKCK